jgi:hypothetical protein
MQSSQSIVHFALPLTNQAGVECLFVYIWRFLSLTFARVRISNLVTVCSSKSNGKPLDMNRNHHLKDQFETTSRRNTESLVPAICGGEWQSVAKMKDFGGCRWTVVAMSGNQWQSVEIGGYWWSLVARLRVRRLFVAVSGDQ